MASVYLILGAAGSGRREVVADLIEGALSEGESAAVYLSESETPDPADARLPNIIPWRWTGGIEVGLGGLARPLAPPAYVFFITDGRSNPIDQLESFKSWLESEKLETPGLELARILCVVNCRLAEQHPPLLAWYDACIHFSDIVLLNRRESVANKWMSDFQARIKGQFLPCLIEPVKAGRVKNPALILDPQPRRMSHYFDEDQEWVVANGEDEEEGEEGEDEVEVVPEEDPYMTRHESGRRVKELPNITKYLA